MRFFALALIAPKVGKANSSSKLPGFRLLAAGNVQALGKAALCFRVVIGRQEQFPLNAI